MREKHSWLSLPGVSQVTRVEFLSCALFCLPVHIRFSQKVMNMQFYLGVLPPFPLSLSFPPPSLPQLQPFPIEEFENTAELHRKCLS